jgi:hypothetical protein
VNLKQKLSIAFCLIIERSDTIVSLVNTYHQNYQLDNLPPGIYRFSFDIPKYILNPGSHTIGLHINDQFGDQIWFQERNLARIQIDDDNYRRGATFKSSWNGAICLVPEIQIQKISGRQLFELEV